MRLPKLRGYTFEAIPAWWVSCDQCESRELVFGHTADQDAIIWARQHLVRFHAGTVHATAELAQ